jgi:hypothetical protein
VDGEIHPELLVDDGAWGLTGFDPLETSRHVGAAALQVASQVSGTEKMRASAGIERLAQSAAKIVARLGRNLVVSKDPEDGACLVRSRGGSGVRGIFRRGVDAVGCLAESRSRETEQCEHE